MPEITGRLVDAAEARSAKYFVRDSESPGFGLRALRIGPRAAQPGGGAPAQAYRGNGSTASSIAGNHAATWEWVGAIASPSGSGATSWLEISRYAMSGG